MARENQTEHFSPSVIDQDEIIDANGEEQNDLMKNQDSSSLDYFDRELEVQTEADGDEDAISIDENDLSINPNDPLMLIEDRTIPITTNDDQNEELTLKIDRDDNDESTNSIRINEDDPKLVVSNDGDEVIIQTTKADLCTSATAAAAAQSSTTTTTSFRLLTLSGPIQAQISAQWQIFQRLKSLHSKQVEIS